MSARTRRNAAAVLVLAILIAVAALPFHLFAAHADEAERGVCGICIALSLSLAPDSIGLIAHETASVITGLPVTGDGHVESIVTTLDAPRGPPSFLA
jgi:hypothetical protein